ncbi:Neutral protease 2 [Mycena indigotica]|uniref:deuterolysin n=1 Tax=Mycena indigotica TaxID=2126181 RepID=A0A8H6TFJ8_9AGAR|nr:Neutral protease 2 [Mycena indigotica]KAF7315832.1 Neutral protease 2 [Mycena indigotica]
MFRAGLLLSLATVVLGLSAGDLKVSVKAVSQSVKSVEDIVITAVVSNPTKKDIRVIAKNNILDGSATRSFAVSKADNSVLFTGVRTTLDLTAEGIYTTIPAGSSIAVNHTDLGALYDFEHFGTGSFHFAPNTFFQTGPDATPIHVKTDVIAVEVTHDVAKRELFPLQARTSTPVCGDGGKLQVLTQALASARSLAGGAATDLQTHPNSAEFNTYFGGNDPNEIWYDMDRIAGDLSDRSGDRSINCNNDPAGLCGGNGGVIAYTIVVTSGGQIVGSNIYTCDILYTDVQSNPSSICTNGFDSTTSSTGGVILHELSHATSGSADIIYGCSNTAQLSPADKKNNADNFRCMGLAIYKHYDC